MKIDFRKDRTGLWVVGTALGADTTRINEMRADEDGCFDVWLTCGGIELDFSRVCQRIDEIFDEAVETRAGEMYLEQFDHRAEEICGEMAKIAARLKEIRRMKFPEIKWDED